jgi:hypothetical protein
MHTPGRFGIRLAKAAIFLAIVIGIIWALFISRVLRGSFYAAPVVAF